MPLIAVVTPLFPLPDEPYRGQPIYESVRALQRYADVRIFCPITSYPSWSAFARRTPPSHFDLTYSPPGVEATYFSYSALPLVNRPWNGEICARQLSPYLEKLKPDLILNYWVYPEGYAAVKVAQRLGVPAMVCSRGSDLRRIEDPLTRRRISTTLRHADHVLTVSGELRNRAIELGANPDRTTAILNGCDHETFRPTDQTAARKSLGLSGDERVILYVGRFANGKGILDLFESFRGLAREHPELRLVCVGGGPLESRMEAFVEAHGLQKRIVLTGELSPPGVARWMTAANLFCLPSHSEGCPNVLIEALSCGCPVVGSDVGGIPELVAPDSGILVPAKDVTQLTAALRAALSRDWDRLSISRAQGRTWDHVARETFDVCRKVLKSPAASRPRRYIEGRMRITVVTPYFPTFEGSYRGHSAFQTLRFLKNRADIEVICPLATYPPFKLLRPKNYEPPTVTYHSSELRATYFKYPALPVITRPVNGLICEQLLRPYVRQSRPDIILNYWLYPEGFSAMRVGHRLGVPVVVGAIGSDVRRITNAYIRHLVRRTVTEAAGVITVSEELRQQTIALGVPPERVTTILNGCDASIFRPGDRNEARRQIGIDMAAELILYVGSFLESKGLAELIDAFAGLARTRPAATLALIGEGTYREALEARAIAAGVRDRVIVPGRQESPMVAKWMQASDIFCLPSYSEGCPNVVVEALSCGRPVVATNVGGIPELVREDCGILIPPQDAESLRRALDAALSRNWDRDGIARLLRRDWDQVAEETFAVCRRILTEYGRVFA